MFEIGEKVVCIKGFSTALFGPKPKDIVTIHAFAHDHDGDLFFILEEYLDPEKEHCFFSENFRKMDKQFAEELLERITKEVEKEQVVLI